MISEGTNETNDTTPQPGHDALYESYQRRVRRTHTRAYQPWTIEEEARLQSLTQEGKSEKEIAVILERKPGAVSSRLKKMAARQGATGVVRHAEVVPVARAAARTSAPKPAYLKPGNPEYPHHIASLLDPPVISALGDTGILKRPCLALFCSVRVPGDIILKVYDLPTAVRSAGITMIGGFHTPIEKECLTLLLRGRQPVIVCLPRSIEGMRAPREWRSALAGGRLLLLSPFAEKQRHATAAGAEQRNRLVAAIADAVLVAHANPGGKTEQLCREVIAWGKPLYTLGSPHNAHLIALGAQPIDPPQLAVLTTILNP